jgi:xanthine dehydrogenase YagS FAD-binding subunit
MNNFEYARAGDIEGALRLGAGAGSHFIAGGTNLLDLVKCGVTQPRRLIDITQVAALAQIQELEGGAVRVGALARNSDMAEHPLIRERHPLLSRALLAGASPQLRNMATAGGNLLQRTRCPYFFDVAFDACNKRRPGSGCAALDGFTRNHAILGASDACIAVNPSDMSVALVALDAIVQLRSARGSRRVPVAEFQRLPGDTPQLDNHLAPGEIITAIDIPPNRWRHHSVYLKVRDRASFAFALVSVAAALDLQDGVIRDARVVMGGVAHKPWAAAGVRELLRDQHPAPELFRAAAEEALRGAVPRKDNAFKVELGKRAVVRALSLASSREAA